MRRWKDDLIIRIANFFLRRLSPDTLGKLNTIITYGMLHAPRNEVAE